MAIGVPSSAVDLNKARQLARQFARDVRNRFGGRVRRLRLFGSAARGDWTPESDIDVLVTLDKVAATDVDWLSAKALRAGLMETGTILQSVVMEEDGFLALIARERGFALAVEREGMDL